MFLKMSCVDPSVEVIRSRMQVQVANQMARNRFTCRIHSHRPQSSESTPCRPKSDWVKLHAQRSVYSFHCYQMICPLCKRNAHGLDYSTESWYTRKYLVYVPVLWFVSVALVSFITANSWKMGAIRFQLANIISRKTVVPFFIVHRVKFLKMRSCSHDRKLQYGAHGRSSPKMSTADQNDYTNVYVSTMWNLCSIRKSGGGYK